MEIPLEHLQVHEVPCYDAKCSAVFKGTLLHDDVAIKSLGSGKTSRATVSIFSDEPPCPNLLRDLKHEVSIMRRLTHKNIVRFKGVVVNPPSIVTEYCERGSLWNILSDCRGSTRSFWGANDESVWIWRTNIALQIAKGMYYLHWQVPIVLHNDLKSPNVFVDDNWVVKIGDFGSATVGEEVCRNPPDNNTWKSPEQMKGQKPTAKSDVFSFAVILWELYSFDRPWDNLCDSSSYPAKMAMVVKNFQIREKVLKGERLKFPDYVVGGKCNGTQDEFKRLIEMCWHPDPDARPDFGKIIDILTGLLNRLQKPKQGLEEMRLMSMKDLLLKNHPAHVSQGKSSCVDVKECHWNTQDSSKPPVKRPMSKHSQTKWRFFNMMKLVQKVKPSFMGALKKTSPIPSKDSYSFSVESDQSGSTGVPIKQLKSPFDTRGSQKDSSLGMSWNVNLNKGTASDRDESRTSVNADDQTLALDKKLFSCNMNSTLGSRSVILDREEALFDGEGNDRLVEFENSLHDYFADESSSFEGLDAYIKFAEENYDAAAVNRADL